ncbi:MAG: Rrf2 family transcriptional regulator [Candidatus Omnitrophota bacterium]
MKLITRDTDYALRALCFIAKNKDKVTPVSELVRRLRMPRPFLRKILQSLDKIGLLKSYKGKGGGFLLTLKPDKISILDVMRIFQGEFNFNECLLNKRLCPDIRICILKKKIDRIEKYVISELNSFKLAYLLE